jgi:imidazolonepropionase
MSAGILISNIKGLIQTEEDSIRLKVSGAGMSELKMINDAFLLIRDGVIADFGKMDEIKARAGFPLNGEVRIIDAGGRYVFPSFCDSHTHLVYAGSREHEFTGRIRGYSYEEIARRGGGILNSARQLHDTTEDDLYFQSLDRINGIIRTGTGAVEIKSGYGLNTDDELKILRVIRRLKENCPVEIKATFLGAHALPPEYTDRRDEYIGMVVNEMLPVVASEGLADYIDVFCDDGFFSVRETEIILMAGLKYGLTAKLHANELGYSGGVQVAVKYNALSADHLECAGDDEIQALLKSETMPAILPGSVFFLGLPDPPVRKMIDAGLPLALASDYNPGSCPSGNMELMMSLGCIRHRMLPEEVINAVTINGACAMGISGTHGSISRGKVANVFITREMPSYEFMPYAFGNDLIGTVILKGRVVDPVLN